MDIADTNTATMVKMPDTARREVGSLLPAPPSIVQFVGAKDSEGAVYHLTSQRPSSKPAWLTLFPALIQES
jgi:hypothetical protein